MKIIGYRCTCDKNVLIKTNYIEPLFEYTGQLLEETSITEPIFRVVAGFDNTTSFPNYIYVEEFKRYYYITDIISVANDLWELHCSVDVLMSFKDLIILYKGYVDRNEFDYNPFVVDNNVPLKQGQEISNAYVPNAVFNDVNLSIGPFEPFGFYILHGVNVGIDTQ